MLELILEPKQGQLPDPIWNRIATLIEQKQGQLPDSSRSGSRPWLTVDSRRVPGTLFKFFFKNADPVQIHFLNFFNLIFKLNLCYVKMKN